MFPFTYYNADSEDTRAHKTTPVANEDDMKEIKKTELG